MNHDQKDAGQATSNNFPGYQALALYLAGENTSALRWAAALVDEDQGSMSGTLLLGHLFAEAGRHEIARRAFRLSFDLANERGALALALAACHGLRSLGDDIASLLDRLATSFCQESPRLQHDVPPPLPPSIAVTPLPASSSETKRWAQAEAILGRAEDAWAETQKKRAESSALPFLPLFSRLSFAGLRKMLDVLEIKMVPADARVVEQGEEGKEAYLVARGELVVVRDAGAEPVRLADLSSGDWFGEMALLARASRAASVIASTPSILLVARRENLDAVAAQEPALGRELAAYCRRRMVQNLARISPILQSFPPEERLALVERLEVRTFEEGESLIAKGQQPAGLFLIASGAVAVSHPEDSQERLILATLGVGDVIGEVALMFRRNVAVADVVAVYPTVTLFLPRDGFYAFIKSRPALLAELYDLAVRRDEETSHVVEQDVVGTEAEDYVLL